MKHTVYVITASTQLIRCLNENLDADTYAIRVDWLFAAGLSGLAELVPDVIVLDADTKGADPCQLAEYHDVSPQLQRSPIIVVNSTGLTASMPAHVLVLPKPLDFRRLLTAIQTISIAHEI